MQREKKRVKKDVVRSRKAGESLPIIGLHRLSALSTAYNPPKFHQIAEKMEGLG
ncbi:hypothetical protein ACLOJK_012964 [Asimina triloba]